MWALFPCQAQETLVSVLTFFESQFNCVSRTHVPPTPYDSFTMHTYTYTFTWCMRFLRNTLLFIYAFMLIPSWQPSMFTFLYRMVFYIYYCCWHFFHSVLPRYFFLSRYRCVVAKSRVQILPKRCYCGGSDGRSFLGGLAITRQFRKPSNMKIETLSNRNSICEICTHIYSGCTVASHWIHSMGLSVRVCMLNRYDILTSWQYYDWHAWARYFWLTRHS